MGDEESQTGADSPGHGQIKGHGAKFDRKMEEAIAALLTHQSVDAAARAIDVTPTTLIRWMKDPEFDAAYRAARRAAVGQSGARIQHGTGLAVSVLLKVMVDSATPASVRVRAADSVLNHAAKAIELEDIEARVAKLEQAANDANEGRRN
jgi:hypothetical protein